jgi:hypothetical protein
VAGGVSRKLTSLVYKSWSLARFFFTVCDTIKVEMIFFGSGRGWKETEEPAIDTLEEGCRDE